MNKGEILSVVFGAVSLLLSFLGYYFYIKSEIYKKTEDAVNGAEATGEIGSEKLKSATERLYMIVPAVLRPLITRDFVEKAVQSAFDKIEEYAKKQKN